MTENWFDRWIGRNVNSIGNDRFVVAPFGRLGPNFEVTKKIKDTFVKMERLVVVLAIATIVAAIAHHVFGIPPTNATNWYLLGFLIFLVLALQVAKMMLFRNCERTYRALKSPATRAEAAQFLPRSLRLAVFVLSTVLFALWMLSALASLLFLKQIPNPDTLLLAVFFGIGAYTSFLMLRGP